MVGQADEVEGGFGGVDGFGDPGGEAGGLVEADLEGEDGEGATGGGEGDLAAPGGGSDFSEEEAGEVGADVSGAGGAAAFSGGGLAADASGGEGGESELAGGFEIVDERAGVVRGEFEVAVAEAGGVGAVEGEEGGGLVRLGELSDGESFEGGVGGAAFDGTVSDVLGRLGFEPGPLCRGSIFPGCDDGTGYCSGDFFGGVRVEFAADELFDEAGAQPPRPQWVWVAVK